ncbi:MAG: PmoA family protein [Verrucomicrobiota bacterium]
MKPGFLILKICVICLVCAQLSPAAEITTKMSDDHSVDILIDGELFTTYHFVDDDTNKPYLWPIIGPTGKPMTRAFPMKDVEGERQDHAHHRSFWFGHNNVNGFDTWHEPLSIVKGDRSKEIPADHPKMLTSGTTSHKKLQEIAHNGDSVTVTTTNDYTNPDGDLLLTDKRALTFHADDETGARIIDVDITLIGVETEGEPTTLGDAKDAGFSVRVAHPMSVDAEQGGRIINSNGDTDKDAWGKRAEWCDFNGPVEEGGETMGVAILNHPSSFRHPTPWHVRTYGLQTANAFGLKSLETSDEDGTVILKPGETITLRHRVIFHEGDEKQADIPAAYKAYAAEP